MGSKTTTVSDWLADATRLQAGDRLEIWLPDHQGPPPTFADMQAALHAQLGADTLVRIYKHGQRVTVFVHPEAESRERFDHKARWWPQTW